jgi:hypothetical protein
MIQVHAEDFQFGLLGGVVTTGAEVPAPSASTPYFSSDTHRQLINIGGIGTGIRHQFPYASDEFRWQYDSSGLRWTTNASNSSNTFVMRLFNRNTGQTLMRVVMVQGSQSTTKAQYWNGAAWTDFPMGGTANILEAAGQKRWTFDIKLDNADGWMRWYAGGVLIDQLVGDTIFTATTDLTDGEVWGHGQNLGSIHYHTNFVWTDTADPRDFQIVVRAPTADGAENTMASGTYADVDDNVYAAGDSTYGEVGDRHLMVYEDLPASVTGDGCRHADEHAARHSDRRRELQHRKQVAPDDGDREHAVRAADQSGDRHGVDVCRVQRRGVRQRVRGLR